MIETNFYDTKKYFAIIYEGVTNEIIEPMNWNKVQNRIPRDPVWFGFTSDFIEDKVGLTFTFIKESNGITGGGELLKFIMESYGQNAEVYFQIGDKVSAAYYPINTWRINLNEYSRDISGVLTSIEKMPFQGKIRARMSAPCTINTYSNIDGEKLGQISTWQINMHSKVLQQESFAQSVALLTTSVSSDSGGVGYNRVVQPDTSNQVRTELSNFINAPVEIINLGATDIETLKLFQFYPEARGGLSIYYKGKFKIYFRDRSVPSVGGVYNHRVWNYRLYSRIKHIRYINGEKTVIAEYRGPNTDILNTWSGAAPSNYIDPSDVPDTVFLNSAPNRALIFGYEYEFELNKEDIVCEVGDEFFIDVYMIYSQPIGYFPGTLPSMYQVVIEEYYNELKLIQLTSLPNTRCFAYRTFDVINQLVENYTGKKDRLISNFFSEGGFGYDYMLTNGYAIRNFGADIYKPKKDLNSLLEDLRSIFFIGCGYKGDYLVVESASEFFKGGVIDTFDVTYDWKDVNNAKVQNSKIDIGYNKFSGLNLKGQDEFCTAATYVIPNLAANGNTLSLKTNIIAAGYLIEEARRNQFSANQNQSTQNDEDIFIVAVNKAPEYKNIAVEGIDNYGELEWVSGGTYNPLAKVLDVVDNSVYVCILSVSSSTRPGLDATHWKQSSGVPCVKFNKLLNLQLGDKIYVSNVLTSNEIMFTVISQAAGYPDIQNNDMYVVQGGGVWASGTWYVGNMVSDPTDGFLYLCFQDVTSSTRPGLDGANWIKFRLYTYSSSARLEAASPDSVFSERNEPFEICANVISPDTVYNARLSLKHILYNWRPFIGISFSDINKTSNDYKVSRISVTDTKMNALLATKFLSTEVNKGNALESTLVENQKEIISKYLANGENLHSSMNSTFKTKIGWNRMNRIRLALTGQSNPAINYGGIIAKDDYGVYWFCYIMDISYNFSSEIASMTVAKKLRIGTP